MKVIYKYILPYAQGLNIVQIHDNFEILSLALQRDVPHIWVECDNERPLIPVEFYVVLTGGIPSPHFHRFLGTLLLDNGDYVIHVYTRE